MPPDPEILFAPGPERLATTNAWAFLHWLRHTGRAPPADPDAAPSWEALRGFLAAAPDGGAAALAAGRRRAPGSTLAGEYRYRIALQPGFMTTPLGRRS